MLVLNKTHPSLCVRVRIPIPAYPTDLIARAPFPALSFSLPIPLCGFYNQIRVDVSPREYESECASLHASAWITFERIYILRLMWAVGDDKCSPVRPNAPNAPPQPDFVNRLTHPSFFYYVRSNAP